MDNWLRPVRRQPSAKSSGRSANASASSSHRGRHSDARPTSGELAQANRHVTNALRARVARRRAIRSTTRRMKVLFILGFGPIVRDMGASTKLYREVLGIAFKEEQGGYLHTESVKGANTFALWPLAEAARSCFGTDAWPADIPAPQAWLEFDVDDVRTATAELEARGYRMLIKNQKEPWGQTVSRFITPEGLLVGVTFTPSMREGP